MSDSFRFRCQLDFLVTCRLPVTAKTTPAIDRSAILYYTSPLSKFCPTISNCPLRHLPMSLSSATPAIWDATILLSISEELSKDSLPSLLNFSLSCKALTSTPMSLLWHTVTDLDQICNLVPHTVDEDLDNTLLRPTEAFALLQRLCQDHRCRYKFALPCTRSHLTLHFPRRHLRTISS